MQPTASLCLLEPRSKLHLRFQEAVITSQIQIADMIFSPNNKEVYT